MTDSQNPSAKREPGETESDWSTRVRRIRRETVIEVLESFGMTVDDVNELQADFQHLRRSRKISEQVSSKLRLGVLGILFAVTTWGVTWFLQNVWPGPK